MARLIISAIHADVPHMPSSARSVAGYTTGPPHIRWTAADWGRFHGAKIRINQDPLSPVPEWLSCDAFEGAWTIDRAVYAALHRRTRSRPTTFCIMAAQLDTARRVVAAADLQDWVWFWLIGGDLTPAEAATLLGGPVVAVRYASPESDPQTLVPGSALTLAQANCHLSVAVAWWHPEPEAG